MRSLGAALEKSMWLHRSHVAIEFEDETITYGVLDDWSDALASLLARHGVAPGDRVALLLDNCPEFLVACVAVARIAAAKLPLNPVLPPVSVRHMLDVGDARVIVVGPGLAALAREAVAGRSIVVIQLDGDGEPIAGAVPFPVRQSRPARARPPLDREVDPELPAVLQFTGGTTGLPKGAIASQRGTLAFHLAQVAEAEIRQHERLLLTTPVSHAAGAFAETALMRGGTVLLHRSFDVSAVVHALRTQRVTWTFLVPTMLYRILDALPADLGPGELSLETVVYGAAPISPRRLRDALSRLGPVFVQLYGQTECPVWGTRLGKADHDLSRPHVLASCGQASLMSDVRIVDDAGQDVPIGSDGEIALRAPYTLQGYAGDPVATAEKFFGDWIRTGDLGSMDAEGFVYLKDRRADLVISGGMNVYSREVEDALQAHPLVRSAAVIGVPHEDWGEAVHAIVVTTAPVGGDELRTWCRGRVAAYAVPKVVEFTEDLPETPYGKVDKKALRARYWKDADRAIH